VSCELYLYEYVLLTRQYRQLNILQHPCILLKFVVKYYLQVCNSPFHMLSVSIPNQATTINMDYISLSIIRDY
jgi:hypothetical protein